MHAEPWRLGCVRTARRARDGGGVRRRSTRRSPARTGGRCQSGMRIRRTRAAPPCCGCTTSCGTCARAAAPERAARAWPLASRARCRARLPDRPLVAGHEPAAPRHRLHHSDTVPRSFGACALAGQRPRGQAGLQLGCCGGGSAEPHRAAFCACHVNTAVELHTGARCTPATLMLWRQCSHNWSWTACMYAWLDDDSGTLPGLRS